uniref:Uncharacterized protein n=1 Tax=Kalanchoe fedtschenkoi TaxID=63787 RepID=A0A7N0RBV5_KALFE
MERQSLKLTQQSHAQIMCWKLHQNPFIVTKLITLYATCQNPGQGEVDKIYLGTPTKIAILDHEKKRTFVMRKDGLPDAVVSNPWDKKAKTMADFGDDKYNYKYMLCVEAAAIEKPIVLKPGEEWRGRQELSVVPSSYCSGQLDPSKVLESC